MDILRRIELLINKFTKLNIQIALAESCTGGYISHMLTNISGASNIFERGIVCYSNQAKIDLLKVNPEDIMQNGAVSENIAYQLALNIRKISNVNIGIGITGIAGPTGGTPDKPVGLVYIGFSTNKNTKVRKFLFKTDRINFKKQVFEVVLNLLEGYSNHY